MTVPMNPDLASLTSLDDPVRRRLYEVIAQRPKPVSRDDAAKTAGIGRALAAYHLDKLVDVGLLVATYQRPAGRTGPGAGRPAKLYTRSDRDFAVAVPPREYELAARLLLRAVESDPSGQSRAALRTAAYELGTELGSKAKAAGPCESHPGAPEPGRDELEHVLAGQGYEPERGGDGVTRLRNCPFHQLALKHKDTVCGMNLALIEGVATGLKAGAPRPVLDPQPGYCCVTIGGDLP